MLLASSPAASPVADAAFPGESPRACAGEFPPVSGFGAAVARWQKRCGRNDLPWQATADPYKIWLAEVMLQQTQATAAVPYYRRFIARFPSVESLARADIRDALAAWSGLGYYARARNLHRAAQLIAADGFPDSADEWRRLPGVGRSTANAVAVFARGERVPILDANVKRVTARVFALHSDAGDAESLQKLWRASAALLPPRADIRAFTQGMMDLGATICLPRAPLCGKCPARPWCRARALGIAEDIQPTRKTAAQKIRPTRIVAATVIRADINGAPGILLERRPAAGVWGGLLAPPECSPADCESRWGIRLSAPTPLPMLVHDFTHFRLQLRPTLTTMHPKTAAAFSRTPPANAYEWIGMREMESAPLPAPIRRELPNWLQFPSAGSAAPRPVHP